MSEWKCLHGQTISRCDICRVPDEIAAARDARLRAAAVPPAAAQPPAGPDTLMCKRCGREWASICPECSEDEAIGAALVRQAVASAESEAAHPLDRLDDARIMRLANWIAGLARDTTGWTSHLAGGVRRAIQNAEQEALGAAAAQPGEREREWTPELSAAVYRALEDGLAAESVVKSYGLQSLIANRLHARVKAAFGAATPDKGEAQ